MRPVSHSPGQALGLAPETFPDAAALKARDERLQALKNLAGHLAHDLNNSLMPLVAYTALLEEEIEEGAPGKQYLAKLGSSVKRTGELIDAILHATHPERYFCPKHVDLASLVERTTEAWTKALPASALIAVETDLAPCQLYLDEYQWTKVIQQLLSNAQIALVEGGRLKLSLQARMVTPGQATELGLTQTSLVELVFQDTGCGMPEDVLRQACDPFFTTRSGSATRGLGLTMVHSVVRLHGGQLLLESVPDRGTRVRIWLPAESG